VYLDHFKLKEKPFLLNTDPRFLWLGKKHKEALALMQSGVQENKGLLLLTGEIGSGKSMLISALISVLDREPVVVAKLPDPGLERKEFFFLVAQGFCIGRKVLSKESFTDAMDSFLSTLYAQGKKALLVIDEAQIMGPSILEEIRLLSNMEYRHAKQLNIFLVGQNEFNIVLLEPYNRSLRERITTSYNLELLSANETATYISHRLKVAGTEKKIFTDAALHEIHVFSNGSPRQINIICDIALVHGFNKGVTRIDQEIIRACKDRVRVPKVPGRPLADELAFDEAMWQTPEILKYRPDSAALLSKTVRRMSWYSALVLLILLPSGYMLYSDWSRSFLPDKIPPLQKVLPITSLPNQSRTSSLAPAPILQQRPADKNHKGAPVSDGTPDARDVSTIPAKPLEDAIKKPTLTSSAPKTSSNEPSDVANAGRSSVENRSNIKATLKPGALQPNSKRVKNKAPQNQKKAERVEAVASDTRVADPATEPIDAEPAAPVKPVPKKTQANRPPADKSTAGSGETGELNQTDIKNPSSEQPDPTDIIKWLLQDKEKLKPNARP
jgi:type II secretory pathway predicted ATPase ExeA